jgi:hypothetical protein
MQSVVQAELKSGNVHLMTWIPTALRPYVDMLLTRKDDDRVWHIEKLYTIVQDAEAIDKSWSKLELRKEAIA